MSTFPRHTPFPDACQLLFPPFTLYIPLSYSSDSFLVHFLRNQYISHLWLSLATSTLTFLLWPMILPHGFKVITPQLRYNGTAPIPSPIAPKYTPNCYSALADDFAARIQRY